MGATKRTIGIGLALAGTLPLAGCGTDGTAFGDRDAGAFSGTLKGRMVDRQGAPLAGTLVLASPGGRTTLTGPDGSYELGSLPAGSYRVAAARDGFRDTALTDSVQLGLLEGRTLPPLGLTFRYGTVLGRVVDSVGNPLPGAGVAVQNQTAQAQSGEGGGYVLPRVEPGRIRIFTALAGVGYGVLDTLLRPQDTLRSVPLRILRKGGTVSGTVVDAQRQPLAGARISALGGALKAVTDRDGRFQLGQVPGTGSVGVLVERDGVRQALSGVRVPEGGRVDLETIAPGADLPAGEPVSVSGGLVFAYTSDSLVTVVADTAGRDTTFRILRWLWSRDGLRSWDTTSTNVWKRSLSALGWGVGDHPVQVCAYSIQGRVTEAVTQTVRVRLPPDTLAPAVRRLFPGRDTTFLWKDSTATVRWAVEDDRRLDSVWLDDSLVEPVAGEVSRRLRLRPGTSLAVLRAVDRAGNAVRDTLRLTLGARGAYDSSLASLKMVAPGGAILLGFRKGTLDYADTVAWSDTALEVTAVPGDSLDTVEVDGVAGTRWSVPLGNPGSLTPVAVRVRAFDGDTLTYRVQVFRRAFDSSYGIPWKDGIAFGSLADARDGRSYRTVSVGGRTWMAQNLDYSGGGKLGTCYNAVAGATASGPADTCAKYGRLYTWSEAMGADRAYDAKVLEASLPAQGICPVGWHLPSQSDWDDLLSQLPWSPSTNFVVYEPVMLRSVAGWDGNPVSVDTVGMRILPSGARVEGRFSGRGSEAYFWTSDEPGAPYAKDVYLGAALTTVGRLVVNKASAIAVRCVRDQAPAHDSTLARLVVASPGGASLKDFAPARQSYVLTVGSKDSTLTVAAVPTDTAARVSLGGVQGAKWSVALGAVGSQTSVLVKVRAVDGDVLTYTVVVRRVEFDSTYGIPWNAGVTYGRLTDARDGRGYRTVSLGGRTWMAQNLAYAVDSSWCPAGDVDSCGKYGRLYRWSAAMNGDPLYDKAYWTGYDTAGRRRGICPAGWHVPNLKEWTWLTDTATAASQAGLDLKATAGWAYLGNGSDALGLRILPAGSRNSGGGFLAPGESTSFWRTEESAVDQGYVSTFTYQVEGATHGYSALKSQGFSLRCVQD